MKNETGKPYWTTKNYNLRKDKNKLWNRKICRSNKTVKASSLIGCTNYDKTEINSLLHELWPKKQMALNLFRNSSKITLPFFWASLDNLDVIWQFLTCIESLDDWEKVGSLKRKLQQKLQDWGAARKTRA